MLDSIIYEDLNHVDVIASLAEKPDSIGVQLEDNTVLDLPYPENWVFFVNDKPFANWHHPCRYLLVNAQNGQYTIVNKTIFPKAWQTEYDTVSQVERPETEGLPGIPFPHAYCPPNPHLYAVIICGEDHIRYWNDVAVIYNTLIQKYGYTKDNIFVHYDDGTSFFGEDLDDPQYYSDDIDYAASKPRVEETFRNLSGEWNTDPNVIKLNKGDQLFVYVTDHGKLIGGHSTIFLTGNDLFDYELAEYIEDIECAQIIFMMQQCFSGGFIDDLLDYQTYNAKCRNRSIHTACSAQEDSYFELWITNLKYDEFTFYWSAAARGYYPAPGMPWNVSYATGDFPFENHFPPSSNHPDDYDPDLNEDGFIQMEEAFSYADDFDTWSLPPGYYFPCPPYTDNENPQTSETVAFQEDLLTLSGLTGNITHSQYTAGNRNYLIGAELSVVNGTNLTLGGNSELYLGNESAQLYIEEGGLLATDMNVSFFGTYGNRVDIDGDANFGTGVKFSGYLGNSYFDGLYLNNPQLESSFNEASFQKAGLHNYGKELNFSGSNFLNCFILNSYNGDVNISGSTFTTSGFSFENQFANPDISLQITGCNFNTANPMPCIDVQGYNNLFIDDNEIHGYSNGINLMYAGGGKSGEQIVSNNEIYDCNNTGIFSYNSSASIINNHIHDNLYGVRFYNRSNIDLSGNPTATNYSETQYVADNESYEVFSSSCSFPWNFIYNIVIDEDNGGNPLDPLVYHDYPPTSPFIKLEVRKNCWGDNFNPIEDLYTGNGVYRYEPIWCPGINEKSQIDEETREMFEYADSLFKQAAYMDASVTFHSIINQYPHSSYSTASLKELFRLESFTGNDFINLRQFFLADDSVLSDTLLAKTGDFLSNKCNEKMENWQEAIGWYETKIISPESLEDSVFAIIDLGNLYFIMANGGTKSSYVGNLPQYKFDDKMVFNHYRDSLLSLLPEEKKEKTTFDPPTFSKPGELLQNTPNPFSSTTELWYKINEKGNTSISVKDHLGREIRRIDCGINEKGNHKVDFTAKGLPSGIYFYSLIINGSTSDSKKMVITIE